MKRISLLLLVLFAMVLSCKREEAPQTIEYVMENVTADPSYTTCTITCKNNGIDDSSIHAKLLLALNEDLRDAESFPMRLIDGKLTYQLSGLREGALYYFGFEIFTVADVYRFKEVYSFNTLISTELRVVTSEITNVGQTSATGGGSVIGGEDIVVSERGICWSTNHNPTIGSEHLSNGYGLGEFEVCMTELAPETRYYVRAYASSSQGTVYGNEVSFTTLQTSNYTISIYANPNDGGIVAGGGVFQQGQSCTTSATANAGYVFSNWTENGYIVSTNPNYTFTVSHDCTLVANFTQNSFGAYVDLGLPSGLLWATCNVGAETPEDYGDYFAWGETQPKDIYDWSTYKYCMGSNNTLIKYCCYSMYGYNGFTDNLTTIQSEDDAATANWGSGWRMPTKEEFEELYINTTVTWVTKDGVNGRLFTATNGNSLFFPAAGCRGSNGLYDDGSYGSYWTSLCWDASAFRLCFGPGFCYNDNAGRDQGRSVRAVRSEYVPQNHTISVSANPSEGGTTIGGGTFLHGLQCVLTAVASDGYAFTNWTENGNIVSTQANYTFTVTNNRTLVANFTYTAGLEIFSETFANGQGQFTIVDVNLPYGLTYVWQYAPNYSCMKASAHVGQNYATESWLVSPAINLSGVSSAKLTFEQAVNYASPNGALSVMISTNYNGNVMMATWNELILDQWPSGNNWAFITSTANLTQYVGRNVTIAFRYTSTVNASATWEVKNFVVVE
jgi:hypothetical protein